MFRPWKRRALAAEAALRVAIAELTEQVEGEIHRWEELKDRHYRLKDDHEKLLAELARVTEERSVAEIERGDLATALEDEIRAAAKTRVELARVTAQHDAIVDYSDAAKRAVDVTYAPSYSIQQALNELWVCVPRDSLDALRAVETELKRLQAIVAKLPETKDGFRVVPGEDFVWHPSALVNGLLVPLEVCTNGCAGRSEDFLSIAWAVSECYFTRKAAQAEREKS